MADDISEDASDTAQAVAEADAWIHGYLLRAPPEEIEELRNMVSAYEAEGSFSSTPDARNPTTEATR